MQDLTAHCRSRRPCGLCALQYPKKRLGLESQKREGWESLGDPSLTRYGCCLSALTGLASGLSAGTPNAVYDSECAQLQALFILTGQIKEATTSQRCHWTHHRSDPISRTRIDMGRSWVMDIAYTGAALDRREQHRQDPRLMDRLTSADARVLLMAGDRILSDSIGHPLWVRGEQIADLSTAIQVFLGVDSGHLPYFAVSTANIDYDLPVHDTLPFITEEAKFRDARAIAFKLGAGDQSLGTVAQAKSLLDWHKRHKFCSNCGSETKIAKGGAERDCPACGAKHFPRTDPVAIMLPRYGDHILLGRGPKMPPGFYSALAGFVEGGESLESAVAREVQEEVGLHVTDVHYVASQPWPWPSSLMMGCIADVRDQQLSLALDEIESAHWMTRGEVRDVLAGKREDMFLPPPIAIAHNLIQYWLYESK